MLARVVNGVMCVVQAGLDGCCGLRGSRWDPWVVRPPPKATRPRVTLSGQECPTLGQDPDRRHEEFHWCDHEFGFGPKEPLHMHTYPSSTTVLGVTFKQHRRDFSMSLQISCYVIASSCYRNFCELSCRCEYISAGNIFFFTLSVGTHDITTNGKVVATLSRLIVLSISYLLGLIVFSFMTNYLFHTFFHGSCQRAPHSDRISSYRTFSN